MQIEDYGELTVVTYSDGKVKYLEGLQEPLFCDKYEQYYYGKKIASINLKDGFMLGCPRYVGKYISEKSTVKLIPKRNDIVGKKINASDFLAKQLEIAKQERLRESMNNENS